VVDKRANGKLDIGNAGGFDSSTDDILIRRDIISVKQFVQSLKETMRGGV
jgi:hypothetical protein